MIRSCPRVRKKAKLLSSKYLRNILCFLESAGRGEGGACRSPGTAEMLRLHGRSGDNDQKLFLNQLGEILSRGVLYVKDETA